MSENELQILKTAILNEMEGQQFYTLAAEKISDTETKDAFAFLAKEEGQHKTWLLNIYQSLSKHQQPQPAPHEEPASPAIFEPGKVTPESGSLEVSVFRIGILMEKASVDFYRQAAAQAKTQEVRDLCNHLAGWETHHQEMLEKIYDHLREEWWQKQGFSPA